MVTKPRQTTHSISNAFNNVEVIPYEECVKQHHMVVCHFTAHIPHVQKRKFSPRIRIWELRVPATASQFQSAFKVKMITAAAATSAGANADTANHVESVWSNMNGPFAGCCYKSLWSLQEKTVEIANMVMEWTGGWNCTREACMVQSLQCPDEGRHDSGGQGGKNCLHWHQACGKACRLAGTKSEAEKEEIAIVSPAGDGDFRITKQMGLTNQDDVDENCVCNDAGELALTDEDKMKTWVEHYARLLSVECQWPSNELPEVPPAADKQFVFVPVRGTTDAIIFLLPLLRYYWCHLSSSPAAAEVHRS